ncbi:MAG: hypothetical protein UT34_C0002G0067 [candidate division WS6 bacterium GW2011_GWF2_39_15]|uniref:HNH endonuclease n=1 Tax=candidate division WS6 bacterium GW2011_GWF2_39_15 TaxID=1619100 RepID=A0A0G0Q572_9BACT|nr:MAG: hypothetical protein UT34_C0002G0067 [candidate division WS6 bacterium GW2011_GWF2_39_15]
MFELNQTLMAVMTSTAAIAAGLAFTRDVAREMYKRDHGVCQADHCIGEYMVGHPLSFDEGYTVNMAHYPAKHKSEPDTNIKNGRCLCVGCHVVEEIQRKNPGVKGLYESFTFRNIHWIAANGYDLKPPFEFFQDWATASHRGRQGLAQAYIERSQQMASRMQMSQSFVYS